MLLFDTDLFLDCLYGNHDWIGDQSCDDFNNNMECNFDGGDCCGPNVNTQWCTECLCLNENVTTTNSTGSISTTTWSTSGGIWSSTTGSGVVGGCNTGWMGDSYCDDFNNNIECNYDGGDCCGANVNTGDFF